MADDSRRNKTMENIANYINGEMVAPASGEYLDNVDPARGEVYSRVPDSDERDIDKAVAAARQAFPEWSKTPSAQRTKIMLRIADLLEQRIDEFARAECIDNGKPISLARTLDIPRAVANTRFFATSITHFATEAHPIDDTAINYTLRNPRGVAGIISPWNLPLYLFTWKISPALATGNTVVAKPSEITPMTAYMYSRLCIEAGLPPGVLNVVHGQGAKTGAALVAHRDVPTVSFTGGTRTGQSIAIATAPRFKKVSLEMGGKNPNIVFADANLEQALAGSVRASFANQGQVCLCGSRLFVEQSIHDRFLDRFVAMTRKLNVGDPLEDGTDQGAVVSRQHLEKIKGYVELAKQEGGQVLCGGKSPDLINDRCKDGHFFEPTVITGLNTACRVNREEIFGPVVCVIPFKDEQQVIEYANSTDYGLSASIWTNDISRAHRVAANLQSGTVWINAWMIRDLRVPFGGMKSSGVGREGGLESLRFFTEPKNVCVNI